MSHYEPSTQVRPFRGVRYNTGMVADLASVLCPPYDIIDSALQGALHLQHPHNMIRLEHPMPLRMDEKENERYRSAGVTYRQWLRDGVLVSEDRPAVYVHDHTFEYRGRRHVRRGLISAVRLRPWYEGVYPHELTGTKAKQDRLELMRACNASFSYPLGLYEDANGTVASLLEAAVNDRPPDVTACGSVDSHRLWVIRDAEVLARIAGAFASESIYIADGHHRYETGLVFQAERRAEDGKPDCQQPYDFIPMTLTAFDDSGLFISPVYRVLTGMELPEAGEIERRLTEYFSIDYVPLETATARDVPVGDMALMAVVGLRDGHVGELRPRPGVDLGGLVPGDHSRDYRTFNVSILNHVVMAQALGINPDAEGVSYSPDLEGVISAVQTGAARMAFLLAPAHPLLVKKIADQMERMPRKSTYFYPKPPTGLVAYPLD